jgi:RNA polymerase-binding transcription factor DksA
MTTFETVERAEWLADMRLRLRATCDEHNANLVDLAAITPDPSDADAHIALVTATRQALADATEALLRIEDGRYGTCQRCGAAIPAERLDILPHARFCVACQSRR